MERLITELEEKDKRLRAVTTEVERNTAMSMNHQAKITRFLLITTFLDNLEIYTFCIYILGLF